MTEIDRRTALLMALLGAVARPQRTPRPRLRTPTMT